MELFAPPLGNSSERNPPKDQLCLDSKESGLNNIQPTDQAA